MCVQRPRQIRLRTFSLQQKIRCVDSCIYFQCWTDVRWSSVAVWKFVNFFGVDSKMTWTGSPVWESFGPMYSRLLNVFLQFSLQVEQCSVLKQAPFDGSFTRGVVVFQHIIEAFRKQWKLRSFEILFSGSCLERNRKALPISTVLLDHNLVYCSGTFVNNQQF